MSTRFDAYTATTTAMKAEEAFPMFFRLGDEVKMTRGHNHFKERLAAVDSSGNEVGFVQWGGSHGDRIMIEVKGERTPSFVEKLREADQAHRCTRMDSCADFDQSGEFERLYGHLRSIKEQRDIYAQHLGDWDKPEMGRTYFMGAPSSAVRVRLYEKGKQPEYRHLNKPYWSRLEVQVRPATTEAKTKYSTLTADDAWGAGRWTRDIAGIVLQNHINPHPAGTTYRLTTDEAALRWMCKQYGSRLLNLADELGGWDVLGLTLGEMVKEEQQRRKRGI